MNNIIQWNCRGPPANFNDFRVLSDDYNPIVCCLQETMLTMDNFVIRAFICIHYWYVVLCIDTCGGTI